LFFIFQNKNFGQISKSKYPKILGVTEADLEEDRMFDEQMRQISDFAPLTESAEVYVLKLAKKYTRAGRPRMTFRDMEKIVQEAKLKRIDEGTVRFLLQEHDLIDMPFEDSLSHMNDVSERQFMRRAREMVRGAAQEFELANLAQVPQERLVEPSRLAPSDLLIEREPLIEPEPVAPRLPEPVAPRLPQ
jgi:hypothetical protein